MANNRILIVEDEISIVTALQLLLKTRGYDVTSVLNPIDALQLLKEKEFDLIITDLNFERDTTSGQEGLEFIQGVRSLEIEQPIMVMTGWGTIEIAVQCMQHGANDFIEKPWNNERLLASVHTQLSLFRVKSQNKQLKAQLKQNQVEIDQDDQFPSKVMTDLQKQIAKLADKDVSILINGENGTGKSYLASQIHLQSARREQALISVNMGAIPETLFESEMFGHVKGAFTDAKESRMGRFEMANGSSLFLDEIANTPLSQQSKLLRVLETGEFESVGSSRTKQADVRLICATNSNLAELVSTGAFRQDLLFRINTVTLTMPPLRERVEDIPLLANKFLAQLSRQYQLPNITLTDACLNRLADYRWPGNLREFKQVLERSVLLLDGQVLDVADLNLGMDTGNIHSTEQTEEGQAAGSNRSNNSNSTNSNLSLMPIEEMEKKLIELAMSTYGGQPLKAAKALGLSRSAFYRRLEKYGL